MRLLLLFALFTFQLAIAADLPDEALARYIQSRVDSGEYVGMIVGYVDGDHTFIQSFGSTTRNGDMPPDIATVFEISSVTKTFTVTLLGTEIQSGRMSLNDTANQHLGREAQFASFDGRPITLLDLAAHQSGLPYVPEDLEPATGPNPFATTSDKDLLRSIRTFRPTSAAGQGYSYSAFAYATIGHMLSRANDSSFESLVAERITGPLGMHDTVFELNDAQSERLATGYTPEGEIAVPLEQGIFRPAGAMYSTMGDLLVWLRANMRPPDSALGRAVSLTHEPRNALGTVGLAWHRSEGFDDRSQFGTAHGYRAYVGFLADGSKGAVVLANTKANVADVGQRLLLDAELPE